MNRVEVLDRVGGLLLLPNTELATTKQVAEFYGVDVEVIKKVTQRNKEELESNGVKVMPYREIKELVNGYNLSLYKISKRGATIFTPRAVLLVGFMLRDSKVAQEVRNQALNIIENASVEVEGLF